MAITATSITPENTLEEFRIQFNKLVIDVDGVASGNTFTSSIIFEGETADESETTLLATDPTADRTITLPDATGTVLTTGNSDVGTPTTSSGDSDFVELVAHLKAEGVRVEIAAVKNNTAKILLSEANYYHEITNDDWFIYNASKRYR